MEQGRVPTRRSALKWIAPGAVGPAALSAAHTADAPERTVKIVVINAPGGSTDTVARVMAEKMAPILGQPVVVEHKPGGSGAIAGSYVSKGPKDGSLIFLGSSSTLGYLRLMNKDLPYDPVKDFTPVALVGTVPVAIYTNPASGILGVQDLVAAARARPGERSYGSSTGVLSLSHLAGELLCLHADIKMIHVPYTGAQGRFYTDLFGGRIDAVFVGIGGGLALAKEGRLKLIAGATRERSRLVPEVPAVGEVYPGFDVPAWIGFSVAAGTPANIVQKLEAAALAALRDPSTRAQFATVAVEVGPALDSGTFAARIDTDNRMWEKTFKAAGLMK